MIDAIQFARFKVSINTHYHIFQFIIHIIFARNIYKKYKKLYFVAFSLIGFRSNKANIVISKYTIT